MSLDNETCEACVLFQGDGRSCAGHPSMPPGDDRVFRYSAICQDFSRSLLCRQVQSLERIASYFAPAQSLTVAQCAINAVEAWETYVSSRGPSSVFEEWVRKYRQCKDQEETP